MMVREKSINKLYAFALAGVFALTLAGCGGGGGTAAVEEEPPAPMPSAQEMCEADGGRYNADGSCTSAVDLAEEMALSGAQGAASMAAAAAMAAVGGAVDPVAASNAYSYAKMAADASEMADAATTSADAMGHQMAAETARDKAMEAAMTAGLGLIMLANKDLNSDDRENAELDGSDVPKAVNNAKNVGAAIAAAVQPVNADPTLGFTNQGGISADTGTAALISADGDTVVAHKAGGSTFSLNHGGTDDENQLLTGETPSRFHIKGNEAQDLLREVSETNMLKAHLVVTTDIEATVEEVSYVHLAESDTDSDVLVGSVITGDVPNDGSDFIVSYNSDPEDNNAARTGEIYCPTDPDTTTCSISVDADGKVVSVDNYQFSSTKEADDQKEDTDYMVWGFWVSGSIRDSIPDTANINAEAGAFAYGSTPFTVLSALKGTASYAGSASGVYSAGGMIQYFDADASLEANFGGATNTDPLGTISGSISGIMAAGQAVDGSLNLSKTNIVAAGTFGIGADAAASTDGVLNGTGLRGQWGGQLFGPAARTTRAQATTFPTGVAGTFSASSQDDKMSLIGAFGAHKQ